MDLQGNVDEWTSNQGKANPARPTDRMEDLRGLRGSHWADGSVRSVENNRGSMIQGETPTALTGFRCAKDR